MSPHSDVAAAKYTLNLYQNESATEAVALHDITFSRKTNCRYAYGYKQLLRADVIHLMKYVPLR